MRIFSMPSNGLTEILAALRRPARDLAAYRERVRPILDAVRRRGDAALFDFTEQFDGVRPASIRVPPEKLQEALRSLPADLRRRDGNRPGNHYAIPRQRAGIADSISGDPTGRNAAGRRMLARDAGHRERGPLRSRRHGPVDLDGADARHSRRAGRRPSDYVVQSAGQGRRRPPRFWPRAPDRHRSGVRRRRRQAIAALAYGTETVPKVEKIAGPGNIYVAAAKAEVSLDPDGAAIDMLAGPSELMVIADRSARAEFVAADMLSQAEHDPLSQVVLLTTDVDVLADVQRELARNWRRCRGTTLPLRRWPKASPCLVDSLETAAEIANSMRPSI